jgi:DNA repair exonuclease SbcCD ATPase subunit
MSLAGIDEQQIQAEIDQLKTQFPNTRDLYREACVLLFFRYGMTPTANKLYQYVRKGSMSAPAEALSKFWLELRDKSRIRIEHPDMPDGLKDAAGNFMGELWSQAQAAAQVNFSMQMVEAQEKVAQAQRDAQSEREIRAEIEAGLESVKTQFKNTLQRLAESEKNHAVDTSTLEALKKSLQSLQLDRDQMGHALEAAQQGFSRDLDKINLALTKAEDRYRALEARSLREIDRERQRGLQLQKESKAKGDTLREEQKQHYKEVAALNKANVELREKLGGMRGQLTQLTLQVKQTTKELMAVQKRLMTKQAK